MFSSARSFGTKVVLSAGMTSLFSSWWYRPALHAKKDSGEDTLLHRRGNMSAIDYHDSYCKPYPLPLKLGAYASTFLVVCACRFFIYCLGTFEIKDDEHYRNFLNKSRHRDPRRPMITLPNHRSLMDDPMVLSSLLPFWMNAQPYFLRWAVCAQEICFQEENVLSAFFGCGGKTLPICRGEGINQPLLLQLARKTVGYAPLDDTHDVGCQTTGSRVRSAGWVNIHPEAGVYQNKHALGGRHNGDEKTLGKLKWGAAKLIVHNPSYDMDEDSDSHSEKEKGPVVIPFYITGMDTVTPLNEKRRLIQPIPVPGHSVKVRFGPELHFDDLIAEYEQKYGKLRKYHCCSDPHCQDRLELAESSLYLNERLSKSAMAGFDKVAASIQQIVRKVFGGDVVPTPSQTRALVVTEREEPQSFPAHSMCNIEEWVSTQAEKHLYHKVMLRIERAMQKLCDENKLEEEISSK